MSKVIFRDKHVQFKPTVKKLSLQNFRGFQNISIDLDDKLTVFISRNGGGKTTVLDAVWECLRCLKKEIFKEKPPKSSLTRIDVKNGSEGSEIELAIQLDYQWYEQLEDEDGQVENVLKPNTTNLSVISSGNVETGFHTSIDTISAPGGDVKEIKRYLERYFTKKDSKPVFRYYRGEDTNGYDGAINTTDLTAWLDRRQKVLSQGTNKKFSLHVSWLREAVSKMLSDQEVAYLDLQVVYQEDGDYLSIEKREGSQTLEKLAIAQLSSGEQTLLEMAADLAISLIEANPSQSESFNPLKEGFGIALIDEVGIHLHPGWQREVLPKLQEIFPNVQFVVTTHSPLVLGLLPSENIWLLDEGQVFKPDPTFGRDVSTIISKVMDTPSNEFEKEYKKVYRLLARKELEKAEEILNQIEQEFKKSGDDVAPEFRKLSAILERKKIIKT